MDVAGTPRDLRGSVLTSTDPANVLALLPDALIQPAQVAA
jgi:hypothetical protein